MDTVTIKINGQSITVPQDYTVMQAAEDLGIIVPRLCFLKDINETSACRLCVVDVKGMRGLKNSCTLAVTDGMEVDTDNQDIQDSIVENLKLLASNHIFECWACEREHNCEFLDLMRRFNVENIYGEHLEFDKKSRMINDSSPAIVLDSGKCVLCGRCVSACEVHTGLGILTFNERGNETYIGPANFHPMEDSGCINCGKCIQACPVAAIKEQSHIDPVLDALKNKNQTVVAVVHPTVAVTLGEEFGMDFGTNVEGKLYASLQSLGFDEVMGYDLAHSLRVMEEAAQLIDRVNNNKITPLLSSFAPGWLDYIEQYEPEFLEHIAPLKSPQQIAGILAKHHFSASLGYQKENVVVVSISPAIDKKSEAARADMSVDGIKDVDYVLTTKEFARLLKRRSIPFLRLADQEAYGELAALTSAGTSKHDPSGVLNDTLRAVSTILGEKPQELKFKAVRGQKDMKEATYRLSGKEINVAVVDGGMSLKEFFAFLSKTKKAYHFVEYQEQLGGFTGGGEPIHSAVVEDRQPIHELRFKALMEQQEARNEEVLVDIVTTLYQTLKDDNSDSLTRNMLHGSYQSRTFYK